MKTVGEIADKIFYETVKIVGFGILIGVPVAIIWGLYSVLTK